MLCPVLYSKSYAPKMKLYLYTSRYIPAHAYEFNTTHRTKPRPFKANRLPLPHLHFIYIYTYFRVENSNPKCPPCHHHHHHHHQPTPPSTPTASKNMKPHPDQDPQYPIPIPAREVRLSARNEPPELSSLVMGRIAKMISFGFCDSRMRSLRNGLLA